MVAPIQVVAPYPELAELARRVIADLRLEGDVVLGDLIAGLEAGRKAVAAGAEVLVSRGGTALLLRRHLDNPVVEIGVTAYDLIRCLKSLPRGFAGEVGIVGYENVIANAEMVGQAMSLQVTAVTLTESARVNDVLARAVEDGIEVVIGDAVTVRSAQEMGIPGLLITSGREAIEAALREAQRILEVLRHERQQAAELKAILNSSNDGIVLVDQAGRVKLFNRRAAELFGVPEKRVLGRPVSAALGDRISADLLVGDMPVHGRIAHVGNATVMVNRVPISVEGVQVGSVATIQDVTALQRAEQKVRRELHAKGFVARHTLGDIITNSDAMRRIIAMAARFAQSDSTVLIQGESGTGKELFAQGIHNASPRRSGPFVAVNCAAIPESLLESELFGYEEGSFTGASKGGRAGLFELAHNGTIFLDEIGEMPLPLQSRLLRVLQEREVMRIGSDRVLPVNIRVIAATNRPLEEEVAAGRFRADLYYRLNILSIVVPPVRERPEDVPLLLYRFLEELAAKRGQAPPVLSESLIAALQAYAWPGNVRELRGVAERIDLLAAEGRLDEAALSVLIPRWPFTESGALGGRSGLAPEEARGADAVFRESARLAGGGLPGSADKGDGSPMIPLEGTLDQMIDRIIQEAIAAEHGNLSAAARRLGVDRTTLWRRIRRRRRATAVQPSR